MEHNRGIQSNQFGSLFHVEMVENLAKKRQSTPKYILINFNGTGCNKVEIALRTFRLTSLAHLPDPLEFPKYGPKGAKMWPK